MISYFFFIIESICNWYNNRKKNHLLNQCNPEFLLWAFGPNYKKLSTLEKMFVWNKRHGTKLLLKENGYIEDDLLAMGAIWADEVWKEEEFASKVE